MLVFKTPVEFLGLKKRNGEKNGKPWEMVEAVVFIPRLGRVQIPVEGQPKFPEVGQTVQLDLDVEQGKFQSMRVVWNELTVFKVAA